MEPETILTSVIEVAIGIAGFSGIVAALSQKGSTISEEGHLYLRVLLTASFLCIFFSFLPMLLIAAGIDKKLVWVLPSGLWVGAFILVFIYRVIELSKTGANFVRRPVVLLTAVCGLSAVGLCVTNVLILESDWPYLVAMVLVLFAAAFSFVALLYELLLQPAG